MTIRQFADTIGVESMREVKDERSFHSISSESESRINMAVAIFMEYAKYLYENNTHLFATLKNEVFTEAMNFANNNTVYIDKGTFIKRLDSELDHFKTEMNASRKNSIKNTRINGEVQKELSTIIRNEIKDPRIHPMTSVMAVEVAPDLKTCRAYISVLGEKEAKEATIKGLNSAEGYIRRQLARNLNLRNTPEIRFILDESIEYGVNMSKLIDDVTKKDSNSHRQDEEQDEN